MKIAIIGAGVAGLAAAWRLNEKHDITIYESSSYIGGHACTKDFPYKDQLIPVDTGFLIFFSDLYYPNLEAMFKSFGVKHSFYPFTVAGCAGEDQWSNQYHNTPFWGKMAEEIARFTATCGEMITLDESVSTKQYLDSKGYSQDFQQKCLIPMLSVIYVTRGGLLDLPARNVGYLFSFSAMSFITPTAWRVVNGGSREYVKAISSSFQNKIRLNSPVKSVRRYENSVTIVDETQKEETFDKVVIALSAWKALSILESPSENEKTLLGLLSYEPATVVLHTDERVMPQDKNLWSFFNYISSYSENGSEPKDVMTYCWQRENEPPIFITIDPPNSLVAQDKIISSTTWQHCIYDTTWMEKQKSLHTIQGELNTWFCGGHSVVPPYHEAAFCSGLVVASCLGADYPFPNNFLAKREFLNFGQLMLGQEKFHLLSQT